MRWGGARLAVAMAVPALLLIGSRPGEACSCRALETVSVARQEAAAVFLGVVTARRVSETGRFGSNLAFRFRVWKAWKGVQSAAVEVRTPALGTACGAALEVGGKYLVYAHGPAGSSSSLVASGCSRTQRVENAERGDFLELGPPEWTNPSWSEPILIWPLLKAVIKRLLRLARELRSN